MPRIDNSIDMNLRIVRAWGARQFRIVSFDPDDPGRTPPIDVCQSCQGEFQLVGDADHPSYAEACSEYRCAICQAPLTADDD